MKRTKNMIYQPSEESRELLLYTVNTGRLYTGLTTAIISNLKKKHQKGVYNPEKAVDLYYNLATAGSNEYNREFGYSFSVTDRFTAAVDLEEYYREQVEED